MGTYVGKDAPEQKLVGRLKGLPILQQQLLIELLSFSHSTLDTFGLHIRRFPKHLKITGVYGGNLSTRKNPIYSLSTLYFVEVAER